MSITKQYIKNIIREELEKITNSEVRKVKKYIGQCDVLRRNCDDNEGKWQNMMKNKREISIEKFFESIKHVDLSRLLDEDETIEGFVGNSIRSDSDTAAYASNWGDSYCVFFQTAGFEFIFV